MPAMCMPIPTAIASAVPPCWSIATGVTPITATIAVCATPIAAIAARTGLIRKRSPSARPGWPDDAAASPAAGLARVHVRRGDAPEQRRAHPGAEEGRGGEQAERRIGRDGDTARGAADAQQPAADHEPGAAG